jgi:spore coat protein U-like protein
MKIRLSLASALYAAIFCCAPVFAATCTVANATLTFGSYNPVSGSANMASTSITVTCSAVLGLGATATVSYNILISAGSSGDVTNRAMTGGTPSLPYNIYTSGSYTTVWDNTTGVSGSVLLSGPLGLPVLVSGSDTKTAFGRILASQPVQAGSYLDTLTINVNY